LITGFELGTGKHIELYAIFTTLPLCIPTISHTIPEKEERNIVWHVLLFFFKNGGDSMVSDSEGVLEHTKSTQRRNEWEASRCRHLKLPFNQGSKHQKYESMFPWTFGVETVKTQTLTSRGLGAEG
jgi:hypothetical protein